MHRTTVLLLLAGCSRATDFDDPENVAAWANSASPLSIFGPAHTPLQVADDGGSFGDPACPSIDDDGTTAIFEGGCTDNGGADWVGRATVDRSGDDRTVTLDGWGSAPGGDDPATIDGTWEITGPGPRDFHAVYTQDGLVGLDVDYSGTVDGGFTGPTTWSGDGEITRSGFTEAEGTVSARSVDLLRDGDVCNNQNASGTTTLDQGGTEVVITYDGATDCDEAQSVPYTVDGEAGIATGVGCANAGFARVGVAWLVLPLLLRRRSARR